MYVCVTKQHVAMRFCAFILLLLPKFVPEGKTNITQDAPIYHNSYPYCLNTQFDIYCSPSLVTENTSVYYWLFILRKPYQINSVIPPCPNRNIHLIIRLLLANQVELNPGPRSPRWPCGVCERAVTWKHKALECDTCKRWYHMDCQGMSDNVYSVMDSSNLSWHCIQCGVPNFSSSLFNSSSLLTPTSSNSFSEISSNLSPGSPNAFSSPKTLRDQTARNKNVSHPLRVICLNFQSIKNKKAELDILIDSTQPDIIIGSETWLDPSVASSEFFHPSMYTVFRKDRPPNKRGQSHGGVLIAVRSEFQSIECSELQTDCEVVWVELSLFGSRKVIVGSFYRPQPGDISSLPQLNISLSRINPCSKSVIILGGDFNLGHIDWQTNSTIPGKPHSKQHEELLDIVSDHSLNQIVNAPTRNDKTLDLLFTNYPAIVDNVETIPPIGEADHDIVLSTLNTSLRRCKTKPRVILKYSRANWPNICEDLKTIHSDFIQVQHDKGIDDLWCEFSDRLKASISKNIPSKMSNGSKKLPWITNELRRKLDKLKRKSKKCRKQKKKRSKNLQLLKAEIQREQRAAYWKYVDNLIFGMDIHDQDQPKTNKPPKNLFSYIKSQKTENSSIPPLRENGLLKSDPKSKANILNRQFQHAFTPVSDQPIPDKGPSPFPNMPDISISTKGIEKLLGNIRPNTASGPDKINARVLKECKEFIAPILEIIFSKSLREGKVPQDWKHANVCPAYKKGDKHDAINYRPISLTCICCKLLEHIISSNVMSFLESNNTLYNLQHGFRVKRSCETQLISFLDSIGKSFDRNIQVDIAVMDFAKAFDKVSHKHLLYKLKYYGITSNVFPWITDFLSNRTQTVVLEGEESSTVPVTSGVPQGTVLGPILFLIYINDLPDYLQHSTLRLFADDSIIYRDIKNESDAKLLQADLEAAGRWEKEWLMHFHPDKCNILRITQKRSPIKFQYSLHNHPLEKVDSAKYLGVTLQNNLKWDKHINNITNKANQSLGFLKRNLKVSSQKAKDHAYKALVRPKLEYAATVWDPHHRNKIKQIENVQRRAARFVCNRFHNTSSVTDMLHELEWPRLEARRARARLIMFYKIVHNFVAIHPGPNILIPTDPRTRYHTPFTFRPLSTTKDAYKFSFYPQTIPQWNLLPTAAHTATTVTAFKSIATIPVVVDII